MHKHPLSYTQPRTITKAFIKSIVGIRTIPRQKPKINQNLVIFLSAEKLSFKLEYK